MEASEFAYAAGFFDGEGSIDIRFSITSRGAKKYERFHLRVCVVQIDRRPLDWLCERWGGSVSKRKNGGLHTWVLSTASAAKFLSDVLPFLIVKRDEAQIAMEFQRTMRSGMVNTAGSKGVDRLSVEDRQRRFDLMRQMRDARLAKGISARDRANVPATRVH